MLHFGVRYNTREFFNIVGCADGTKTAQKILPISLKQKGAFLYSRSLFDGGEVGGEGLAGAGAGNRKFRIAQFGDAGQTFGLGQPFSLQA